MSLGGSQVLLRIWYQISCAQNNEFIFISHIHLIFCFLVAYRLSRIIDIGTIWIYNLKERLLIFKFRGLKFNIRNINIQNNPNINDKNYFFMISVTLKNCLKYKSCLGIICSLLLMFFFHQLTPLLSTNKKQTQNKKATSTTRILSLRIKYNPPFSPFPESADYYWISTLCEL